MTAVLLLILGALIVGPLAYGFVRDTIRAWRD